MVFRDPPRSVIAETGEYDARTVIHLDQTRDYDGNSAHDCQFCLLYKGDFMLNTSHEHLVPVVRT